MMRIVATRLRAADDTAPTAPTNGETRLAAEAALASFRGEIIPASVRQRMMATFERWRA